MSDRKNPFAERAEEYTMQPHVSLADRAETYAILALAWEVRQLAEALTRPTLVGPEVQVGTCNCYGPDLNVEHVPSCPARVYPDDRGHAPGE